VSPRTQTARTSPSIRRADVSLLKYGLDMMDAQSRSESPWICTAVMALYAQ
jgi:hypothetical protein